MKYFIASDIHGSAYYCDKMLEAFEKEKAARLVLLGDILYHGPRNDLPAAYDPKQVIAMLNPLKRKIFCIRGNCDCDVDQMVLEFPIMAEYAVFDPGKNDNIIYATHGHIFNEQKLPPLQSGDILLHGHTHVPVCVVHGEQGEEDHYIYMNPGSVSIPKDGSWHGYMTLENGLFVWKDLDGKEMLHYEV